MNTGQLRNRKDAHPWYHYGWPWFLISVPLISVVLGCSMMYLALTTNNSMVVDDYYRQGKAINVRIERDRAASLLGVSADMNSTLEGLVLQLSQTIPTLPGQLHERAMGLQRQYQPPEAINVQWVHVTQEDKDLSAEFVSLGGGRYLAAGKALPESGIFRVHINPGVGSAWRLISAAQGFEYKEAVHISPPSIETMFRKKTYE